MQAEERKQLERNALAQQLARVYEGIKQGPSRGTIIVVACLIAVVVIVLLFRYFWSSSVAGDSHRWLQLDEAVFAEKLDDLAQNKEFKDGAQGRLARFKEARMNLSAGLRDYGSSSRDLRDKAAANLQAAVEQYKELGGKSSRVPLLHQEALWGQAKGTEALASTKPIDEARDLLKDARDQYDKLATTYPNSALGKDAKKQLDRLKSRERELIDLAKEFGPLSR